METPESFISCDVCDKPAIVKCRKCKTRKYCGRQCQKQDWKYSHKQECISIGTSQIPDGYGNDILVMIITWNMAGQSRSEMDWNSTFAIDEAWSNIVGKKSGIIYDIYAVGLQECGSSDGFVKAFSKKLENIGSSSPFILNVLKTRSKIGSYDHKLAIWVKGSLVSGTDSDIFKSKRICLGKSATKLACTKSSLITTVTLRPGIPKVVLISSHFPVDTKQEDLGSELRQAAYEETLNYVNSMVTPTRGPPRDRLVSYFWFGDLNYRVVNGKEQLGELMKTRKAFRAYEEGSLYFAPTCKFFTVRKKGKLPPNVPEYDGCRSTNDLANGKQSKTPSCYNPVRTPSYCDRILYSIGAPPPRGPSDVPLLKISPLEYKSFYSHEFASASDHNPVMGSYRVEY